MNPRRTDCSRPCPVSPGALSINAKSASRLSVCRPASRFCPPWVAPQEQVEARMGRLPVNFRRMREKDGEASSGMPVAAFSILYPIECASSDAREIDLTTPRWIAHAQLRSMLTPYPRDRAPSGCCRCCRERHRPSPIISAIHKGSAGLSKGRTSSPDNRL